MKTKVRSKLVKNMTQQEYMDALYLNFRGAGSMMYDLQLHRSEHPESKARAILIYEDTDAPKPQLISWALLQPRENGNPKKGYLAYFYTRSTYRRQGYGKRLMRYVKRLDAKPEVCPHDETSGAFFRNYRGEIRYEKFYEVNLK